MQLLVASDAFFHDTGCQSHMGFEPRVCLSNTQAENKFVDTIKVAQEEVKATLSKAKDDMAHYYDHGHTPAPKYQSSDHVYFEILDITTTQPS